MNTWRFILVVGMQAVIAFGEGAGASAGEDPTPASELKLPDLGMPLQELPPPALEPLLQAATPLAVVPKATTYTEYVLIRGKHDMVLIRSHKGESATPGAADVMRIVTDGEDQESVQRLEKKLRSQMSGAGVNLEPYAPVEPKRQEGKSPNRREKVSPEAFVIAKSLAREIVRAKETKAHAVLESLKKTIADLTELTAQQRLDLEGLVDEALAGMSPAITGNVDFVSKLVQSSR